MRTWNLSESTVDVGSFVWSVCFGLVEVRAEIQQKCSWMVVKKHIFLKDLSNNHGFGLLIFVLIVFPADDEKHFNFPSTIVIVQHQPSVEVKAPWNETFGCCNHRRPGKKHWPCSIRNALAGSVCRIFCCSAAPVEFCTLKRPAARTIVDNMQPQESWGSYRWL